MRHAVHVWETVLRKQHNQIVLGDKRVDHVIKQWAAHASWLEKLTLAVDASLAPIVRWFQPDILEALGSEEQIAIWRDRFRRRAPAAYRAICVERELHMAWCVRDSAAAINAESVALVCGVLHAKEIEMLLHQGRRVDIKKLTRMST